MFSSINLIENENIIPNKKYDSEEIYVKNNILLELKEENICNNNDKIIHGHNYNNNYKYIDNQKNPNFIAKNNSFLLSDCYSFCNIDNTSIKYTNNI